MKTAIIGSGITAAVLAREIPDSVVFDKDEEVGGRTSTKEFSGHEQFDICSTVFSDKVIYTDAGNTVKEFSFLEYLKDREIEMEYLPSTFSSNYYYPKKGMRHLIEKILSKSQVNLSCKLEDIIKDSQANLWKCIFDNGKQMLFDRVILTAPLPKAFPCLKSSKCMFEWEDFTYPYIEYKTSTILAGLWKNLPETVIEKIQALGQITYFQKNKDAEFISIESLKYGQSSKSLIVSIQFSQAFSSRNLERWVLDNTIPTELAKRTGESYFQKFFESIGIQELKGKPSDEKFAFRKRYAAPDNSLWGKDKILLDANPFLQYLELGRKHGIWLAGDWLFGPRISRCALGAVVLAKNL